MLSVCAHTKYDVLCQRKIIQDFQALAEMKKREMLVL